MAYRIRTYIDIDWVGTGTGSVLMGQSQANNPGYSQSEGPGSAGVAQTKRIQSSIQVPGGDAPSLANLKTALDGIASIVAGSSGTPLIDAATLAEIQGWATGNP